MAALDGAGNTIRSLEGWVIAFPSFKRGFVDSDGNFWVADGNNGLLWKHTDGSISLIQPNGPRSEAAWAIAGKGGKLWVASGSMLGTDYSPYEKNGISRFADNDWHTFDCTNDSIYAYTCAFGSPAVVAVAIDPHNPDHAFIGSWGNGLLEYTKDGGIRHFLADNSALVPRYPSQLNFVQVGGVTFDDDGNLWAVSAGTTEGICVKTKDDVWQKFTLSEAATAGFGLYGLVIDDFGQKWFIARTASSGGEGVCVFKEKNLTSQYNGQYKRLNDRAGTGSLPDLFVRSIAKDKDGSIWLGTNKGVAVVYNPGNVFTGGSYDAQKIIIQQDGYNQYLLETESVNAIAIDGANRKWFGTYSGGVFLMSADATHQILNFNMDNSPLPSNYIASIAIDDLTGEVFFATDKGIISYRGDATEGGQQCENHYVFPNPVKHEYRGPIAIRGLVANADVKIADVAGNIVYHTKANGGEAIWYGNNMNGERAQTGVYIVYVTNEDGSETCTTKMLFAN